MSAIIRAADLFCGAGGSSTGLRRVADALGARLDLTAVNHWPTAVETHAANHPEARHICEPIDGIAPRQVTGGDLDLLWASPSCVNHISAKGDKAIDDEDRATAWAVLRWAEATRAKWVIVENVEKGMGLKKGQKVRRLAVLRIVSVREEPLADITPEDVIAEGFPEMTPREFTEMFMRTHPPCSRWQFVNRIAFEYVDGAADAASLPLGVS
ncbi:DNA cytosine methyltransferase [Luteitalea sp.]|uniref:DNA cytosine methyltransferase n=1 Tax=Luteitalea sp. TaxID=2004800 RepID=UPI0025BC5A9F|nr:DNA cytosine methyltransferase [Luteitalea sp.]